MLIIFAVPPFILRQSGSGMRLLAAAILLLVVMPVLGQRMDYFTKGTARCSACRAVTATLVDRLDKEKPRNHLVGHLSSFALC